MNSMISETAESFLASFPATYADRVRSRLAELINFENLGMLPNNTYDQKSVLDWEAETAPFPLRCCSAVPARS
jgi:hypothetical protein